MLQGFLETIHALFPGEEKAKTKSGKFLRMIDIFGIRYQFRDIKRSLNFAKEAKQRLNTKDNTIIVGREDFETMIKRLKISEKELAEKTKLAHIQTMIYGASFCLFLIWALYLWTWPVIISGTCALIISGLLWFKWSLRLYRLRYRDLVDYKTFLNTKEWYLEWLR